jgi:hypothetical protein
LQSAFAGPPAIATPATKAKAVNDFSMAQTLFVATSHMPNKWAHICAPQ